ncbi:MAG: SUMF1/EgtB/PvdO family nonheme iron enzyme [Desulfobacterales bacterium]|nr:SUMF1/EgtB/PvdO family nonheme iron enzyme [Desulfobacterales bacterium]
MPRLFSCLLVAIPTFFIVIASTSPSMGGGVVFKTWNKDRCDYTKWSVFKLDAAARVDKVMIWRHWEVNEKKIPFKLIDSQRKTLFKGALQRGLCDPFQQHWCRGKSAMNLSLEAGSYAVEVDKERICQNAASKGQGFIVVEASPAAASGQSSASTASGQPSASTAAKPPVKIETDKRDPSEILDPVALGAPGRRKETWLRKWSDDGSFDLWITGGRNLHCLFMPSDWPEAEGWQASRLFPGFKHRCQGYLVKKVAMVAEKSGKVESVDPAKSGDTSHGYESWLRLTNKNGAFHMWVTDGRNMHCIYKPKGFKNTGGWSRSTIFKKHVVRCNSYHPISMKPDGKHVVFDHGSPGTASGSASGTASGTANGSPGGAAAKTPALSGKVGIAKTPVSETLDPAGLGARERKKETWVRAWGRDGGFDLWTTGGRDLHCLFLPSDRPEAGGWGATRVFPGFKYRCRGYQVSNAAMAAEKNGRVEVVDPAKAGDPDHAHETWVKLSNKNGGYHMWVTGDRDLHCLFQPRGAKNTRGWKKSPTLKSHVFACNAYHPISMKPGGESENFDRKQASPATVSSAPAPKEAGIAPGPFQKGLAAAQKGDYAAAYKTWRPLAKGGDVHAQFNIAVMYDNGKGLPVDKAKAAYWYRAAARLGFVLAQENLALCFYRGEGVKQDKAKAISWFHAAADQGNRDAQYNLGMIYIKGDGVAKNEKKAFSFFKKSGKQGFPKAQFNTALMYDNGQGTRVDKWKATWWYRAAADQGLAIAQHNLGLSYYHGEGAPKNHSEALRWFLRCAENGNKGCAKNAKILKKAGVKKPAGPPPAQKTVWVNQTPDPGSGHFVSPPAPPPTTAKSDPAPVSPPPASPPVSEKTKPEKKPAPSPTTAPPAKPKPAPKPVKGDRAPATIADFSAVGTNEFGYKEYKHRETGMVFVLIPEGAFIMGRNDFKPFSPEHEVYLDAYLIGKYEVTQGVWERYMGEIPSYYWEEKGDNIPVGHASWNTYQKFCRKTGLSLPSEAEWEKACKAGTQTKFYWGDDYKSMVKHAWCEDNSGKTPHPVGGKTPNGYGLYDMAGNVAEWCQDYHQNSREYYVKSPRKNPMGPKTGSSRVHRGGSFRHGFRELWSSGRKWGGTTNRGVAGIRPVVRLGGEK